MSTFEQVYRFAAMAHRDQRYGPALYFHGHVLAVLGRARTLAAPHLAADVVDQVALLHDVLEDTDATTTDLRRIGVSERVIEQVQMLTRAPDEAYHDYVERIAGSPFLEAKLVKVADLLTNIAGPNDLDRPTRTRYADALTRLWGTT